MQEIEDAIKAEVEKTKEFSKEKINESINFIHENMDKIKDVDISKKIYEYATFLEHVAKKTGVTVEHEVVKFANNAKEYASSAFVDTKEVAKDGVEVLKEQTHTLIHLGTDMIDDFSRLINNKKSEN